MATPLPTIAANTEETAFVVGEGNELLREVNLSIIKVGKGISSSFAGIDTFFKSFSETLKEQHAALMAKMSLAPDNSVKPESEPDTDDTDASPPRSPKREDKGSLLDNVIEYGLAIATGMSIKSAFSSMIKNITKWVGGIVNIFKSFGKGLLKFGKLAGRLAWPITAIIGTIGGIIKSWESFANGNIWQGMEEFVMGFFNTVITIPLDLIKDGVAWLLKKMGFDESADVLNSFSFTEEFNKIIGKIFEGLKEAFKVITDLFTWGEEDKTALGALGKLTDIVYAPINMVIGYVRGIFGWSDEDESEPFKLQDWIGQKTDEAIEWVKGLFSLGAGLVSEGWTNLGDFVSGKWTEIKTWFTDKLTMLDDKATSAGNFISTLVTDAWQSIEDWFTESLAGIADSLPTMNDIKTTVISSLPHWMVPDSFKTPQMRAETIEQKIAETQAAIEEDSLRSVGISSADEKRELAELFREQNKVLAEMAAERTNNNSGAGAVVVRGGDTYNSTSSGNGGGGSTIVLSSPSPVGALRPDMR